MVKCLLTKAIFKKSLYEFKGPNIVKQKNGTRVNNPTSQDCYEKKMIERKEISTEVLTAQTLIVLASIILKKCKQMHFKNLRNQQIKMDWNG